MPEVLQTLMSAPYVFGEAMLATGSLGLLIVKFIQYHENDTAGVFQLHLNCQILAKFSPAHLPDFAVSQSRLGLGIGPADGETDQFGGGFDRQLLLDVDAVNLDGFHA